MPKRVTRAPRAGFTVLEVVVSMSIFLVISYTLVSAIRMGHRSHSAMLAGVAENSARRECSEMLLAELKCANAASIVVEPLPDGNSRLSFMLPIETEAGGETWGIYEDSLSPVPAECSQADWRVCYTVVEDGAGQAGIERQLVRQVLDEEGLVRHTEVVATGLTSGAAEPCGFSVEEAGDLWSVTLTFESSTENGAGKSGSFHVRTRN